MLERAWRRFIALPIVLQLVAWVLAWPLVGAIYLGRTPHLRLVSRVSAVVLVLFIAPMWFSLPFVDWDEPVPTPAGEGEEDASSEADVPDEAETGEEETR
jgi:hypothetical protein